MKVEGQQPARCGVSEVACAADPARSRQRTRRRHAAVGHGLPDRRRRERHDGLVHPVELHGLRLRRGRAGHGHQPAESRLRVFTRRPATRTWLRGGKRPFHTIIPALHDARGQGAHELRRDGRGHAAARPPADGDARHRLRTESANGCRRAALENHARRLIAARTCGGEEVAADWRHWDIASCAHRREARSSVRRS